MRKMNFTVNGKLRRSFLIVFLIFCIIWTIGCSADAVLECETSSQSSSEIDSESEDFVVKLYTTDMYEGWETAYKNVIVNAEDFLQDLNDIYDGNARDREGTPLSLYIGICDFDSDGIPELILSDTIFIGVYTFEENYVKRIAGLYVDEYMYGVNGCHYAGNCIYFQSDGSDGSSYLCWTTCAGENVIGFYDDYQPEKYVLNKKEVSYEEFVHVFNMNDMKDYQHNELGYFELDKENGMLQVLRSTEKRGEVISIEAILK